MSKKVRLRFVFKEKSGADVSQFNIVQVCCSGNRYEKVQYEKHNLAHQISKADAS